MLALSWTGHLHESRLARYSSLLVVQVLGPCVKRTPRDFVLLGKVWAELGSGRIAEGFIPSTKHHFVEGEIVGQHITVNPAPNVVDSAIHEILHRLNPAWSENYVRRTTTHLLRRMTDEEVAAFYDEFRKRARKRKTKVTG